MQHREGGPAFPTPEYYDEKPIGVHPGLSRRDYFAGQAMAGMLASFHHKTPPAISIAMVAFEFADAMLEASKRKPEPVTASTDPGDENDRT